MLPAGIDVAVFQQGFSGFFSCLMGMVSGVARRFGQQLSRAEEMLVCQLK